MKLTRAFMLVLILSAMSFACDKPKPKPSPAERLAAIQKEDKDADEAFRKTVMALPETPEGEKKAQSLLKNFEQRQNQRFAAVLEIAKADPKSDVGFAALEWLLTIPRAIYLPEGKTAIELTMEHHTANPKVGKIIAWLGYSPPRRTEHEALDYDLFDAVTKENPDRTARGQAYIAKAWEAESKFAAAEYNSSPDVEKLAAQAEKAFELVIKDYGDCLRLRREGEGTLGDLAKKELFQLRHLRVGKIAPDIEAEDLDGVKFKLSDYRGKVLVLDFWGDW